MQQNSKPTEFKAILMDIYGNLIYNKGDITNQQGNDRRLSTWCWRKIKQVLPNNTFKGGFQIDKLKCKMELCN